jgi:hypothetical protein
MQHLAEHVRPRPSPCARHTRTHARSSCCSLRAPEPVRVVCCSAVGPAAAQAQAAPATLHLTALQAAVLGHVAWLAAPEAQPCRHIDSDVSTARCVFITTGDASSMQVVLHGVLPATDDAVCVAITGQRGCCSHDRHRQESAAKQGASDAY